MSMNMVEAINSAHRVMLAKDPEVLVFGEDVGFFGGVFNCTADLQKEFGEQRVFDAPISENGIVAAAIGMGVAGLRPVAEIQFADYIYPGFDQVISEAAKIRYRSGGQYHVPITLRTPCGGGIRGGETHSQSPESLFTHVSGIKTVMPSNPYDAKGLLISSIEDDDPVVFFEPKRIYNGTFDGVPDQPSLPWSKHPKGEVPDGHYRVPLGQAAHIQRGDKLSIITYGTMVHVAEAALAATGVSADIIDLRTLWPLDRDCIVESVRRTGRCLIVHEAPRTSGFGAELCALVQEHCFWHLEAPIARVTGWDTPYPHILEWDYFPTRERVATGIMRLMETK